MSKESKQFLNLHVKSQSWVKNMQISLAGDLIPPAIFSTQSLAEPMNWEIAFHFHQKSYFPPLDIFPTPRIQSQLKLFRRGFPGGPGTRA